MGGRGIRTLDPLATGRCKLLAISDLLSFFMNWRYRLDCQPQQSGNVVTIHIRGDNMRDSVSTQLASLAHLSKDDLSGLWRQLFQSSPPQRLRRPLMVRILAYRIQEQAFGGLSVGARKRLSQIAKMLERDPAAELASAPAFKPGTRLLRQWRDQTHVVTVTEKGYEYHGSYYRSLSEIARLITGSRWSGPLFFGLKRLCCDRNDTCFAQGG
jgi:hypothetical protein